MKIDSANTLVFQNAEDLKDWASRLKQPHWLARWTMGVAIPHPKTPIRQAMFLDTESEQELPWERRRALNALLRWMRDHNPHSEIPEYANKSYLPDPDDFVSTMTDAEFAARGITIVRESIAWWPPDD